jgi:MFS family permease
MERDMTAVAAPVPGWRTLTSATLLPRLALLCLGTWLTAADTLVTATMMPTIAREIGGYAWFGWAVAGFVLGSILAGATSGRLAMRLGLKRSLMLGGLVYAVGCGVSAASPDIAIFLAGRGVQGVGGGWTSGLCYVAMTQMFEEPLWPRVLSALAAVWGLATLSSPLIGGLFAEAGLWRGGFWMFAVQGLMFVASALLLVPGGRAPPDEAGAPWRQALALVAGLALLSAAGVVRQPLLISGMLLGAALLGALFLRLDARSASHLLPRGVTNLRGRMGAGLMMILALTTATVNFTVYGPAMMQALHGASPVLAGYVLVTEAVGWTAVAMLLSGRSEATARRPIRIGAVLVASGLAGLALAVPFAPLWLIALAATVQGAGFGALWALATSRVVAAAPESERALASAAVPTTQLIGSAAGAAITALIANAFHLDAGITPERAATGGVLIFAAFLPLALAGVWAAWRLTSASGAPAHGP